ncbi:MAG: hypothetical protein J6Q80_02475, partial [Lentisphaeria bacterium]|nr:hypothetical protein [Lentisphaeria bacterium]
QQIFHGSGHTAEIQKSVLEFVFLHNLVVSVLLLVGLFLYFLQPHRAAQEPSLSAKYLQMTYNIAYKRTKVNAEILERRGFYVKLLILFQR